MSLSLKHTVCCQVQKGQALQTVLCIETNRDLLMTQNKIHKHQRTDTADYRGQHTFFKKFQPLSRVCFYDSDPPSFCDMLLFPLACPVCPLQTASSTSRCTETLAGLENRAGLSCCTPIKMARRWWHAATTSTKFIPKKW